MNSKINVKAIVNDAAEMLKNSNLPVVKYLEKLCGIHDPVTIRKDFARAEEMLKFYTQFFSDLREEHSEYITENSFFFNESGVFLEIKEKEYIFRLKNVKISFQKNYRNVVDIFYSEKKSRFHITFEDGILDHLCGDICYYYHYSSSEKCGCLTIEPQGESVNIEIWDEEPSFDSDKDGNTPLHEACLSGDLQRVTETIIKYGIFDATSPKYLKNRWGRTPLYAAVHARHYHIGKWMNANGFPPENRKIEA